MVRTLTVRYRIVAGRTELLPLCSLRLFGPKGGATVEALIDSGATYSVFPTKAADDTGIPLPAAADQWLQSLSLAVAGRRADVDIALQQRRWRAPVVFVERLPFRYALLGRSGVFSQFREVAFVETLLSPHVDFRW